MTVFLSHTMSSVAHTACSSSAECLLVSLHNARTFLGARLFAGCCLQNRRQTVKIKAPRRLKPSRAARRRHIEALEPLHSNLTKTLQHTRGRRSGRQKCPSATASPSSASC